MARGAQEKRDCLKGTNAGLYIIATALIAAISLGVAQEPSGWRYVKDDDPLHGKVHDKFVLEGKYLTPPRTVAEGFWPSIVVLCSDGKVEQNYIAVGAVATLKPKGFYADMLESRVDGKKGLICATGASTDGTAVFFTRVDLKKLLRSHQVIVGVNEYLGAEVIMEFDMPDAAPVFQKCGQDRILRK
jgi:hypothetical protein